MHSHLMHIDQRFNPAYAGNMFCPVNPLLLFRVQPRVCGEYFAQSLIYFNWSGSTPRMRGISVNIIRTPPICRFNPAYAGNILYQISGCLYKKVQPRVCGEYAGGRMITCHFQGSTPRMRGISNCFSDTLSLLRFNPAYAGNIAPLNDMYVQQQVQPRVCGEYV